MKTLSFTSALIVATFLTFGFNASAQNNDIIYDELKSSDKPIVIDLVRNRLPKNHGGSACPETKSCKYIIATWANALQQEKDGAKYIQSLENKPPHTKNQILTSDFLKRYEQLSSIKNNNICIDDPTWKIYNDNTGYYFGDQFGDVVKNFTGDGTDSPTSPFIKPIILRSGNKLLQKVPNEFITENVYQTIKNLRQTDGSFMRICGKLTDNYFSKDSINKKLNPAELGVSPLYQFSVERPIEFFKKGDKKPTLTIPLSWYK